MIRPLHDDFTRFALTTTPETEMAPTFDEMKLVIAPSEGNVPYMYLDTVGKVTVGIGNMLPNVAAACALPFVNRTTKNGATSAEITADFQAVTSQPARRSSRFYRPFTKLDLPDPEINRLFLDRVRGFLGELRDSYPDFDEYPDPAQLAMLDMAFNLGTSGLKNTWPRLNAAIDAEDWAKAALECNRPQVNPTRNAATKDLFLKAAEDE